MKSLKISKGVIRSRQFIRYWMVFAWRHTSKKSHVYILCTHKIYIEYVWNK